MTCTALCLVGMLLSALARIARRSRVVLESVLDIGDDFLHLRCSRGLRVCVAAAVGLLFDDFPGAPSDSGESRFRSTFDRIVALGLPLMLRLGRFRRLSCVCWARLRILLTRAVCCSGVGLCGRECHDDAWARFSALLPSNVFFASPPAFPFGRGKLCSWRGWPGEEEVFWLFGKRGGDRGFGLAPALKGRWYETRGDSATGGVSYPFGPSSFWSANASCVILWRRASSRCHLSPIFITSAMRPLSLSHRIFPHDFSWS
mmetsp:Transcript_20329/g.41018  ORF Transcript_20329/g.41018 Transcript_20329/m.41018 type:complete len:259 (-) Transcript_20329:925-1701(-)